MTIHGFKLSSLVDIVGQRIAEYDNFIIVEHFSQYPSRSGIIEWTDDRFYLLFRTGERVELEGNNQNIEIIGKREGGEEEEI